MIILGGKITVPKPFGEMLKIIPKADGHYIRDENAQAKEIVEQLAAFDGAGMEGAFVFTFVSPTSPHTSDPRFDMDLGSYSIVKSYPEKDTFKQIVVRECKTDKGTRHRSSARHIRQIRQRHRQTWKHLSRYAWEPKESFWAVADYYNMH